MLMKTFEMIEKMSAAADDDDDDDDVNCARLMAQSLFQEVQAIEAKAEESWSSFVFSLFHSI